MDLQAVVEWLDPDWRDHFIDIEQAGAHYQQWAPAEWRQAVKEISSE